MTSELEHTDSKTNCWTLDSEMDTVERCCNYTQSVCESVTFYESQGFQGEKQGGNNFSF